MIKRDIIRLLINYPGIAFLFLIDIDAVTISHQLMCVDAFFK